VVQVWSNPSTCIVKNSDEITTVNNCSLILSMHSRHVTLIFHLQVFKTKTEPKLFI